MPKLTRPDAPKALARAENSALTFQTVTTRVNESLAILVDMLSRATPEVVVSVHNQLKNWSKVIEDVEDITKGSLLELLISKGTKTTDKGSRELDVNGWHLEARPHRSGLDAKKVEALIRAKDLSVDELMDKKIAYVLNETRLKTAVEQGLLTEDELESCKYELTYALQSPKKVSKG